MLHVMQLKIKLPTLSEAICRDTTFKIKRLWFLEQFKVYGNTEEKVQ